MQILDYSDPRLPDRFWAKVYPEPNTGCWLWGDFLTDGYGNFYVDATRASKRRVKAHRHAYEHLVEPIPDGLQVDHLCRQRACVNPAHLEPVTPQENTRRGTSPSARHAVKTHCPQGHAYIEGNIQWFANRRICRKCHRDHSLRYWHRKAAKNADR